MTTSSLQVIQLIYTNIQDYFQQFIDHPKLILFYVISFKYDIKYKKCNFTIDTPIDATTDYMYIIETSSESTDTIIPFTTDSPCVSEESKLLTIINY